MLILAFDTSLNACRTALFDTENEKIWEKSAEMTRGQSEALVPQIEELMTQAGYAFSDLSGIAVTNGPGAFTGIRIGLSAARMLQLALDIPAVPVTTTSLLAASYEAANKDGQQEAFAVIIETKRAPFYAQFYTANKSSDASPLEWEGEDLLQALNNCNIKTVIGDGVPRFVEQHDRAGQFRAAEGFSEADPVMLARLGAEQIPQKKACRLEPLYLRNADVSQSKKTYRKIKQNNS